MQKHKHRSISLRKAQPEHPPIPETLCQNYHLVKYREKEQDTCRCLTPKCLSISDISCILNAQKIDIFLIFLIVSWWAMSFNYLQTVKMTPNRVYPGIRKTELWSQMQAGIPSRYKGIGRQHSRFPAIYPAGYIYIGMPVNLWPHIDMGILIQCLWPSGE